MDVVQVSRGCPFHCEFCSVRHFFGDTYRFRPVAQVIDEIKTLRHRLIVFNDDNIFGHPSSSMELLKALIPLKKRWVGQTSLSALKEVKNIEMLSRSGCMGLLIGFESLSKDALKRSRKDQNDPKEYREIIDRLHRFGIAIWGAFVFGFDEDDPLSSKTTVSFAIQTKLFSAVFAILTPYPETAFYHRVKHEGRLVQDQWWLLERPEDSAPHFLPKKMSREVLREGWKRAWKEFNSFPFNVEAIPLELSSDPDQSLVYFPFQWMQHRFTRKKILEGRQRFRRSSL